MFGVLVLLAGCGGAPTAIEPQRSLPTPDRLDAHCRDQVGPPTVTEVDRGIFVARGFDLANTIVVETSDGRVVVDPGMSPARARETKAALDAKTAGPVRAIVYTHSHIDHVGGASVWAEPSTEVWATDAFTDQFFKQYGVFLPAESTRGARQFAVDVPTDQLPCSALGRQADVRAALESGAILPDHTFTGRHTLRVGDVDLELVEAHGETDDQLFVYLAEREAILAGDNVYAAFPNLYTIRGTRPRPTDAWIASLDAMRARDPDVLIGSHTAPVVGRDAVRARLTAYRDAIQWVRSAVIRGANDGRTPDELAASTGLPPELAADPALAELYGQVDWSVRAIYDGELGWFDGRASQLYPLAPADRATRTLALMGGPEAVRAAVASADDPRWALELLELLEAAGETGLDAAFADAQEAVAATTANTNGRGYLLVSARERRAGAVASIGAPVLADALVDGLPIRQVLAAMVPRLRPEAAAGVHESVRIAFDDADPVTLTARHGVLEVTWGAGLPGTPEPAAIATTSTGTWKRLALGRITPAAAIADGSLAIDHPLAFKAFIDRFDQGLGQAATRLP